MTTAERINKTLQQLPVSIQEEVLDFVEFLFERTDKSENGRSSRTGLQKAESIEGWAKGHSLETPEKLALMQGAMSDPLFVADLEEIREDFRYADFDEVNG